MNKPVLAFLVFSMFQGAQGFPPLSVDPPYEQPYEKTSTDRYAKRIVVPPIESGKKPFFEGTDADPTTVAKEVPKGVKALVDTFYSVLPILCFNSHHN